MLTVNGVENLLDCLEENQVIERVILNWNQIQDFTTSVETLLRASQVKELGLAFNDIKQPNLAKIFTFLKGNKEITKVDLGVSI